MVPFALVICEVLQITYHLQFFGCITVKTLTIDCLIAGNTSETLKFRSVLRKIITRYRRIGYNLNVMRQSACLVFNPIMVDNYAASFNCTPVGRAYYSMMVPT